MIEKNKYKDFYTVEADAYHHLRYGTKYGRIFKTLHRGTLATLLEPIPRGEPVLEIACGTGHTTQLLEQLGFQVTATDLTPAMMQEARNRCQSSKTHFIETNANSLPFADNSFNLVISTRFLHLFSYQTQLELLKELRRVTKPGGYIFIDFDNLTSRWILALPHFIYNILRYRRIAPDTHYNSITNVKRLLKESLLEPSSIVGVGGYHLIIPALVSDSLAIRMGRMHQHRGLRFLGEQIAVLARK